MIVFSVFVDEGPMAPRLSSCRQKRITSAGTSALGDTCTARTLKEHPNPTATVGVPFAGKSSLIEGERKLKFKLQIPITARRPTQ